MSRTQVLAGFTQSLLCGSFFKSILQSIIKTSYTHKSRKEPLGRVALEVGSMWPSPKRHPRPVGPHALLQGLLIVVHFTSFFSCWTKYPRATV